MRDASSGSRGEQVQRPTEDIPAECLHLSSPSGPSIEEGKERQQESEGIENTRRT